MIKINVKKLCSNAQLPRFASSDAAGADICAAIDSDITIKPGETCFVPSGIALEIPAGYAGLIFARSGLASKKGIAPANKVGVIDPDYRGEILIALHNHSKSAAEITPGERIAQLLITPVLCAEFIETDSLHNTDRGAQGFGSTGKF